MRRQVALIVETSSVYGREVLAGITQFARMRDEWSVFLEHRDLTTEPPAWLANWSGDGVISRMTTPALREAVARTGVPLVNLTDRWDAPLLPLVRSNDTAIGRIGAEHLLERGFRRFGFCGFVREAWSFRRQEAFVTKITEAGWPCEVYTSVWFGEGSVPWQTEQERLGEWLATFQPPFAVMACSDVRGQHVINACSQIGLAIPEEVAVLGVDDDDLLCRLCVPPLSSIVPNARGVGYRAAQLLSELMDGREVPNPLEELEPIGITPRQSTDVIAIDHPEVAAALKYIRIHACEGIGVEDVVAHGTASRSTLERQFRRLLGRTPQEEVRRVQVNKARELLATTDLTIESLAIHCGFEHSEYLYVVFKRVTGLTPGEFRRRVRSEPSVDHIPKRIGHESP